MPDQHHLIAADAGEAAEDGFIVAIETVAVDLAELSADHFHIIFEKRAGGVAGDLHRFPCRQIVVGLSKQFGVGVSERPQFFGVIGLPLGLQGFKLVNLLLKLSHGFFERKNVSKVGGPRGVGRLGSLRFAAGSRLNGGQFWHESHPAACVRGRLILRDMLGDDRI